MEGKCFGVLPTGETVEEYTLRAGALTCGILTYGGALRSLTVPGSDGKPVDVLLGFDTLEDYCKQDKYIGALIGRYGNRIGGAAFPLNGVTYPLARNDGENHLHGGRVGYDKRVWTVEQAEEDRLVLTLCSPDGEEGYPGTLIIRVTYTLTAAGLSIAYEASTDKDTLCNLTNHAYFNLGGHASGPVSGQVVRLLADRYTPTDAHSIPTGALAAVDGTPMDLRQGLAIGQLADSDFEQLRYAGGYDHNWCVNGETGTLRLAAVATCPETGITMETYTTQPGIQFYSGNYLDGCPAGKGGAPYAKRWGFCLETQTYPDAPNKPQFPTALLKADAVYRHVTEYRFSQK